jgi:hypothetical protein
VTWQINIPFRDRSAPLTDVAEAARALQNDEERAVVRQLVLGEITGGTATTAGELLDKLEAASPGERRQMLDAARVKARLPTTETVEARRKVEAASAAAHVKMARNPGPLRLAVRPGGAIIDLDEQEDEAARARAEAESRQRVLEQQQAERAVEAEAVRRHDEARAAEVRKLVPPGVPA